MARWGRLRLAVIRGLFVCLVLAACGSLSTTDLDPADIAASARPPGGDLATEVDALVRPMVDSGHTPGVAVGVLLPDGSMRFFGYGLADQDTGLKPDADTLFAVGSLSKEYLAALAALEVDDGGLSWDDTLAKLLPPGTPLSPDAARITLLQLATHTSGLPRQPVTLRTLGYFLEYLWDGENFYRHFDTAYTLDYLSDFTAGHPGVPQYSNIGYGLLGYILELHTGKNVDALMQERIIAPLGLRCTGYEPRSLPCEATRARGYAGDQPKLIRRGQPTPDWQFTPLMRGSAGMHSTARDLLTFASAHMQGSRTRFNAVLASNLRVRVPQAKEAAAVAWVVDDIGGESIAYQIGIVAGYTSYLGIDLAHHTAVVVLQNSFNWDNSVGHKILLRLAHMPQPS